MNSTTILEFLLIIHIYLTVRFAVSRVIRRTAETEWYGMKWLLIVFLLPIIGYVMYLKQNNTSNN